MNETTINLLVNLLPYVVVGMFFFGLVALLGIVVQAVTLWKLLRNDPEKREVTLAAAFADKEELRETNLRIEKKAELTDASIRRLHARIDPLVENTAEIKGKMEGFQASFDNFAACMKGQLNGTP